MALELVTDPGPWEPTRWRGATRLEQAHRLLSRVVLCQPLYRGPTEATAAQVRVLEMLGALPLRLNDCGNVAMARNAITARWLSDTSRPWSLWIDGDVSAVEGPLGWVEFVARSLERFPDGEAAICGCYPWRRRGGGRFAVGFDGGPVVLGLEGGYYRVRWCGGGALLLHRTAVELVARAKDLAAVVKRLTAGNPGQAGRRRAEGRKSDGRLTGAVRRVRSRRRHALRGVVMGRQCGL